MKLAYFIEERRDQRLPLVPLSSEKELQLKAGTAYESQCWKGHQDRKTVLSKTS